MTKSPFNALPTTYDLNAAFLSFALSEYDGWISGAGSRRPAGPRRPRHQPARAGGLRAHDPQERDAQWLIEHGYPSRLPTRDRRARGSGEPARAPHHRGLTRTFLGRIFMHPTAVLTEAILRPETQDRQVFVDSVDVMVTTHERVARSYLEDGTIASARPPVRALPEIMANGTSSEGWTVHSPGVPGALHARVGPQLLVVCRAPRRRAIGRGRGTRGGHRCAGGVSGRVAGSRRTSVSASRTSARRATRPPRLQRASARRHLWAGSRPSAELRPHRRGQLLKKSPEKPFLR